MTSREDSPLLSFSLEFPAGASGGSVGSESPAISTDKSSQCIPQKSQVTVKEMILGMFDLLSGPHGKGIDDC